MTPQRNADLTAFTEAAKLKGMSDESLSTLLTHHGWPNDQIFAALGQYWERTAGIAVPKRPGRGESSRDAFLYLLSFATLAIWSSALGSMLFQFIDYWFRDPVVRYHVINLRNSVTWQMASAAVGFPIFLLMMRTILNEARNQPERLQSGVRKWLTYIALLLTAGGLIGDLICFLDYFLTGELSTRFVLKVLTVMMICAPIFVYYLGSLNWDKNADLAGAKRQSLGFATGSGITIGIALCVGLGLAGTPSIQRQLEADQRRSQDLRDIAAFIRARYIPGKLLPGTLAELTQYGFDSTRTKDPETKTPYLYRSMTSNTFELCGVFSGPSGEDQFPRDRFWYHRKGQTCFTLDASSRTGR